MAPWLIICKTKRLEQMLQIRFCEVLVEPTETVAAL